MEDFNLHRHDLFGESVKPKASGPVAEKFTFSPFSVLDARQGEWQERKSHFILHRRKRMNTDHKENSFNYKLFPPTKKNTPAPKPLKRVPYIPTQHPQQHRINEFRSIPSLWTPGIK